MIPQGLFGATANFANAKFGGPSPAMGGAKPSGGGGRRTIGILGDLLLGLSGRQGIYGPLMAQRGMQDEAFARQQQMAKQAREWGMQDYAQKAVIDAQNPQDAYERALLGQGIRPGTPEYMQAMQARSAAMTRDPNVQPMGMNIPGYGFVFGTPEQIQGVLGSQQAPDQLPPDFFD